MRTINFDMDGTIANLYGVNDWLKLLRANDPTPYANAKPLIRLNVLARQLNKLSKKGYQINIISWLSKGGNTNYNKKVTQAKKEWLKKHLKSVTFNNIYIVPYGTPKEKYCINKNDILFDDEIQNRINWGGKAYNEKQIFEVLKQL